MSYAFCCEALAGFDVRDQLGTIRVPTQVVAGALDAVAPPAMAEESRRRHRLRRRHSHGRQPGGRGTPGAFEAPAHVAELLKGLIIWTETRGAGE